MTKGIVGIKREKEKKEVSIPGPLYEHLVRLSDIYKDKTGMHIHPAELIMYLVAARVGQGITPLVLVATVDKGRRYIARWQQEEMEEIYHEFQKAVENELDKAIGKMSQPKGSKEESHEKDI